MVLTIRLLRWDFKLSYIKRRCGAAGMRLLHNSSTNWSNMSMVFKSNRTWRASIHRLDNNKGHTPDNCVLDVFELNVSQYGAIPCLGAAWKRISIKMVEIYAAGPIDTSALQARALQNIRQTPRQNGVTAHRVKDKKLYLTQINDKHLSRIFATSISTTCNRAI